MRAFISISKLGIWFFVANTTGFLGASETLTPEAADRVIEQEMAAKASRSLERRAALESAEILSRTEVVQGDRKITLNRVRPPVAAPSLALQSGTYSEPVASAQSSKPALTEAEWAQLLARQPKHESLSLSVVSYEGGHSEITWRHPENPQQSHTIWTNVDLSYLSPISYFQHGDTVYSYFGFSRTVSSESENRIVRAAAKRGFVYESRWKEPPVKFESPLPEYVIEADAMSAVPSELYAQMDALFAYYLAHEAELQVGYERQQALNEARRRYREVNPPQDEDVVINFWKVR